MEEKKDYRKELFYEKKNGYDSMDAAAREAMEAYCEGYKAYLNDSRTEREAVANAIRLAEREGFVEYRAGMELKAGDKVWFNNRGKALMLAVAGKKPMSEGVVVAAAHVDAPRLDLKQTPLTRTMSWPSSRPTTTAASRNTSGRPYLWSCTASWRRRTARSSRS